MSSSRFRLLVQKFVMQKFGAECSECEDAVATDSSSHAFAIADGATEAFGSRQWARLLVRGWLRFPHAIRRACFLDFVREVSARANRKWAGQSLPWYAEEKLRAGSYAAFLGLRIEVTDGLITWRTVAIGDCCLFHLREEAILSTVPLSDPDQFGFRPTLLPSRPENLIRVADDIRENEGVITYADRLVLLSDAAARWYMTAKQSGNPAANTFEEVLASGDDAAFDLFINECRADRAMQNDDVAAIYIRVEA